MTNPLKGITFPGLPPEFQIPQNAEDVGARPGTWMPSAADVGALPAAFSGTVSDAWVSNKTYYVGDYCIHNNTLWRCLVQNTGVTPAEGTYWTASSVTTELKITQTSLMGRRAWVISRTFSNVAIASSWGNVFESALQNFDYSGLGLVARPIYVGFSIDSNAGLWIEHGHVYKDRAEFYFVRGTTLTAATVNVTLLIIE